MDLSTFIVAVFCLIDDQLQERRIRSRGPTPKLSDSEVLTIEIIGEFLGLDTDKGIYLFFRRHYQEWFPALGEVHRTTFSAAKLPTSGRLKSASGKSSFRSHPMPLRSLSATRCPCQHACLPVPTAAAGSAERPLSVRTHPHQADLLRLQEGARKGLLAWGDQPHLGGPGRHP